MPSFYVSTYLITYNEWNCPVFSTIRLQGLELISSLQYLAYRSLMPSSTHTLFWSTISFPFFGDSFNLSSNLNKNLILQFKDNFILILAHVFLPWRKIIFWQNHITPKSKKKCVVSFIENLAAANARFRYKSQSLLFPSVSLDKISPKNRWKLLAITLLWWWFGRSSHIFDI